MEWQRGQHHPFLVWARYVVHHHKISVCNHTNECGICTVPREEAVQHILDVCDRADRLDVEYGVVRWPTKKKSRKRSSGGTSVEKRNGMVSPAQLLMN